MKNNENKCFPSFAKTFKHHVVQSWERKALMRHTSVFMSHLHQKTKQYKKRLNNILLKMWYHMFSQVFCSFHFPLF